MPKIRGEYSATNVSMPQLDALAALIEANKAKEGQEKRKGALEIVEKFDEVLANFEREEPMELVHWIPVLNFIDEQFDVILGVSDATTCGIMSLHVPHRLETKKNADEIKEQGGGDAAAASSEHKDAQTTVKQEAELTRKAKMDAVRALSAEALQRNLATTCTLLRMTILVLTISFNKEAYASTEHLMALLQAYDDEVMCLAMKAVAELANPPPQHRYLEEFSRHSTALHKCAPHSVPLFDLADAAAKVIGTESVTDIFSDDFTASTAQLGTNLVLETGKQGVRHNKAYGEGGEKRSSSSSSSSSLGDTSKLTGDNVYTCTPGDRSVIEVIDEAREKGLQEEHLPGLLCQLRFRKMFATKEGRVRLLSAQFEAVVTLLCCHADTTDLATFFQDKLRLPEDFVGLIRTGPGHKGYQADIVPLSVRVLACKCLVALVSVQDSFHVVGPVTILGRFSWLQHDLGVNRGQYMGMLPCLLRASSAYLTGSNTDIATANPSSSSSMNVDSGAGDNGFSGPASAEQSHLAWIEQILTLTEALVNSPSGSVLPALTDNGFLTSVLTILKVPRRGRFDHQRAYIDSIIVSILDRAVSSTPGTLNVFSQQKGAHVCVGRILWELEWLHAQGGSGDAPVPIQGRLSNATPRNPKKSSSSSSSAAAAVAVAAAETPVSGKGAKSIGQITTVHWMSQVLIHQLLMLFRNYKLDSQDDADSETCVKLLKGELMYTIFSTILRSPALGATVMTAVVYILTESIDQDISPPALLNHYMSRGLVRSVLDLSNFPEFNSELFQHFSSSIRTFCLTEQGRALVRERNPFPGLLRLLRDTKYYYPKSTTFHNDCVTVCGQNLEELIRHHEQMLPLVMDAIIEESRQLAELSNGAGAAASSISYIDKNGQTDFEALTPVSASMQLLTLVEPLLSRQATCKYLMQHSGLALFASTLSVAIGPSRAIYAHASCTLGVLLHSIGHYRVLNNISLCIRALHAADPELVLELLFASLETLLTDLDNRLVDFREKEKEKGASGSSAKGGGGKKGGAKKGAAKAGKKASSSSSSSSSSAPDSGSGTADSRMTDLLDLLSLAEGSEDGELSTQLIDFGEILREFVMVDLLAQSVAYCCQSAVGGAEDPRVLALSRCFAKPQNVQCLRRLIEDYYLPVQRELARTREQPAFVASLIHGDIAAKEKVVYKLLITGDSVVVKDSASDSAKKTCRLERGAVVDAYERSCGTSGMLKYRTEHGWVSFFRNAAPEPVLAVIDLTRAPEAKGVPASELGTLSPRRSAFWVLFQFQTGVSHVLGDLNRKCLVFEANLSGRLVSVAKHMKETFPIVLASISQLCPQVTHFPCAAVKQDSAGLEWVAVQSPPLAEFGARHTYLTVHAIDHLLRCCIDDAAPRNKARASGGAMLIIHALYTDGILENLVAASVLVLLRSVEGAQNGDDAEQATARAECRRFALSRLSNIIKFWKALLVVMQQLSPSLHTASGQSSNRDKSRVNSLLLSHANEEHSYDALVAHRDIVSMLVKHLYQTLSADPAAGKFNLAALPAFILKALFDLMGTLNGSLRDIRNGPASSESSTSGSGSGGGRRSRSGSLSLGAGAGGGSGGGEGGIASQLNRFTEIMRRHGARGFMLDPRAAGGAGAAVAALGGVGGGGAPDGTPGLPAPAPFAPDETMVLQVMEMGFGRTEITRAANALHSNDVEAVTGYLLEGGDAYGGGAIEFGADESYALVPAPAPAPAVQSPGGSSSSSSSSSSTAAAGSNELSLARQEVLAAQSGDGQAASSSGSTAAAGGSSDGAASAAAVTEGAEAMAVAEEPSLPPAKMQWEVVVKRPRNSKGHGRLLSLGAGSLYAAFSAPTVKCVLIEVTDDASEDEDEDEDEDAMDEDAMDEDEDETPAGRGSRGKEKATATESKKGAKENKKSKTKFNPLPKNKKRPSAGYVAEKNRLDVTGASFSKDGIRAAVGVVCSGFGKMGATLTLIREFQSVPVDRCPREVVNAMVVQTSLSNLAASYKSSDWLVKVVMSTWLVEAATDCINEIKLLREAKSPVKGEQPQTRALLGAKYFSLYGLLDTLMLLLFNRIGLSASAPKHFSGDGHQMLFLFLADRYFEPFFALLVHELSLVEKVSRTYSEPPASKDSSKSSAAPVLYEYDPIRSNDAQWVAPAVLILDAFTQPLLVDQGRLLAHALELSKYLTGTRHAFRTDEMRSEALAIVHRIKQTTAVGSMEDKIKDRFGIFPASSSSSSSSNPGSASKKRARGEGDDKEASSSSSSSSDGIAAAAAATAAAADDDEEEEEEEENLPLRDRLLSVKLRTEAMEAVLDLFQRLPSPSDNQQHHQENEPDRISTSILQAGMQFLAHATRDVDVRSRFREMNGPTRILHLGVSFPTMSGYTFTLTQQVLEHTKGLLQAMETAIKLCLVRLSTKKSHGRVSLKDFVDCLSPLLFRDQRLFLQAMRRAVILYRQDNSSGSETGWLSVFVEVRSSAASNSANTAAVNGAASAAAGDDNTASRGASPVPGGTAKKQKVVTGAAVAVGSGIDGAKTAAATSASAGAGAAPELTMSPRSAHRTKNAPMSQVAAVAAANAPVTQQTVDSILTLIVSQYLRIKKLNDDGEAPEGPRGRSWSTAGDDLGSEGAVNKTYSTHTISQLLLILADLTSTVPGLATCIHKFHLLTGTQATGASRNSKDTEREREDGRNQHTAPALPLKHTVTGRVLTSEMFVTFLVHNLTLADVVVPATTVAAGTDGGDAKDVKFCVSEAKAKAIRKIAGENLRDSAVYLLSALVSIKGDGRRRVLAELVNTINVQVDMMASARLHTVTIAVRALHFLIVPPQWGPRDTFLVPFKDVLLTLCQLNAHTVLAKLLSTIAMDDGRSLEAALVISTCLEVVSRKGLPLLEASGGGKPSADANPGSSLKAGTAGGLSASKSSSTLSLRPDGPSSATTTPRAPLPLVRSASMGGSRPRSSLASSNNNGLPSGARSPQRPRNDSQVSQSSEQGGVGTGSGAAIEHVGGDHLLQNDDNAGNRSEDEDDDADEIHEMMQADEDEEEAEGEDEEDDDDEDDDEDEEEDDEDDEGGGGGGNRMRFHFGDGNIQVMNIADAHGEDGDEADMMDSDEEGHHGHGHGHGLDDDDEEMMDDDDDEEDDDEDGDDDDLEELGDIIIDEDILEEQDDEEEEEDEDDDDDGEERDNDGDDEYGDNVFADAPDQGIDGGGNNNAALAADGVNAQGVDGGAGANGDGDEDDDAEEAEDDEGGLNDMLLAGMGSAARDRGGGRRGRGGRGANQALIDGEEVDLDAVQRLVNESLAAGAGELAPARVRFPQGLLSGADGGMDMLMGGMQGGAPTIGQLLGDLPNEGGAIQEINLEDDNEGREGIAGISLGMSSGGGSGGPAIRLRIGGGGGGGNIGAQQMIQMIEGLANDSLGGGGGRGNALDNIVSAIASGGRGGGRGEWRLLNRLESSGQSEPEVTLHPRPSTHPLIQMTEQRTGPGGALERTRVLPSSRSSVVGALGETFREDTIWTAQDAQRSQRFSGVSPRRSDLGPIVSDRRWGTDIGGLEVPSNRIDIVCHELCGILAQEIKEGSEAKKQDKNKKQEDEKKGKEEGKDTSKKPAAAPAPFSSSSASAAASAAAGSAQLNLEAAAPPAVVVAAAAAATSSTPATATTSSSSSSSSSTAEGLSLLIAEAETVELPEIRSSVCPSGHEMKRMTTNPVEYLSTEGDAKCDVCLDKHLQSKGSAFFHCGPCGWDCCMRCALARWVPPAPGPNGQISMTEQPAAAASSSSAGADNDADVEVEAADAAQQQPDSAAAADADADAAAAADTDADADADAGADAGAGAGAGAVIIPPDVDPEVWTSLPLELKIELLAERGLNIAEYLPEMAGQMGDETGEDDDDDNDDEEDDDDDEGEGAAMDMDGNGANDIDENAPQTFPVDVITAKIEQARRSAEYDRNRNLISTLAISVGNDRLTTPASSFTGREVLARLFRCMVDVSGGKLPRPYLRLSASICLYRDARRGFLDVLLAVIRSNSTGLAKALKSVPSGLAQGSSLSSSAHNAVIRAQCEKDVAHITDPDILRGAKKDSSYARKFLLVLAYVLRKTEKLAWYDVVARPARGQWLFGQMISLLQQPDMSSAANIDLMLYVLEELCSPLTKLSITEANKLVQSAAAATVPGPSSFSATATPAYSTSSNSAAGALIPASASGSNKKARVIAFSDDTSASPTATPALPPRSSSSNSSSGVLNITGSNALMLALSPLPTLPAGKVYMPFPLLRAEEAAGLARVVCSEECNGGLQRKCTRILRALSLSDANWSTLLAKLRDEAARLAAATFMELGALHTSLTRVAQEGGNAAVAMATPHLSSPSSMSELLLLQALRLMGNLRSKSSVETETQQRAASAAVAVHVRNIEFGNLWSILMECLDLVRDLEGINEEEDDDDDEVNKTTASVSASSSTNTLASGSAAAGSQADAAKKQGEDVKKGDKLSSLTMRFMPLIECFLTVCGATVIQTQQQQQQQGGAGTDSASKRARASEEQTQQQQQQQQEEDEEPPAMMLEGAPLARQLSLPGARFRTHPEFQAMQKEVDDTNDEVASRLIRFTTQNRILLNMLLRGNESLLESSFRPLVFEPRCRRLLHFDIKRKYFKMKLRHLRQKAQRGSLRVNVSREHVFVDSFRQLQFKDASELRRKLVVSFQGEEGLDAGGVTREWFCEVAKEIFNPMYALFRPAGDLTFQPNPQSQINPDHLQYFKFVGRVIGKAICDGHLMDAHFTRSFYKHILGLSVTPSDLEAIEPDYYKSLKQILEMPLDMLGLELTFTADKDEFGKVSTTNLVPDGENVEVTDANKEEYVRLLCHHRMTTSIRQQIDSFLEGFHELVPAELVSIFDAQELELLISGLPEIDLDDMRANCEYSGYKSSDAAVQWFWNALKAFSKEEKALFLQFVTGTSKVPLDGFKALIGSDGPRKMNIVRVEDVKLLPAAHTCFNQLDLPEYLTEETMKEKVLLAIKETSGFGFQ